MPRPHFLEHKLHSDLMKISWFEGLTFDDRVECRVSILGIVIPHNSTLRTLNYGNYGLFLIMGNAGFISSTLGLPSGATYGLACSSFFWGFRQ